MFRRTLVGSWLGLLALAAPALAQKDAKVPDPDPEVERQALEVAEGFEVSLFASDPLLAKPIQMNFDAQGRLWVASSEVYPQIEPGQVANDKVLVLEDADGDGKAEKTTVFADGLLIPTGLEPGDGGVYVANSTEILHLSDTDGDGKADRRRVVLAGFGTEDTHHIIHTFRWGEEGFLYFNQSIYIHSHVETPWGVKRLGGGGIWQFRPDSRRLAVFARGLVNPWGHEVDRWGQHFATDGAGGEGINYMIPGASYFTAPGAERIVAGLNPGSPKHCGLEVLSGRHLPDELQGVLITHDFRANRVCLFRLEDDGSGFASRELPSLITTRFPAFRPIDVRMGPDGAIYIADWYNPIIQHGEVDFRDPRRDHTHGRIWRVTAKGRPLVERPKLVEASVPELLDHLKAPEGWTRHFAKRVLSERAHSEPDRDEIAKALAGWVAGLEESDPEAEHHRLEALWTYQTIARPEPALLRRLLASPDPRVRAAAVIVVPHWRADLDDALDLLAARVEDEHPRVRLEAVRALAAFPQARAAEIALRALDRPIDRFLDYSLWLACRELQPYWLPALQAGKADFGGDSRKLAYALQAAGSPEVVGPLLEAVERGQVQGPRVAEVLRLVGALAGPEPLARALGVVASAPDPASRAERLEALARGSEGREIGPASGAEALEGWLAEPATRRAAARAAGAWRAERLRAPLLALASDASAPEADRLAAVEALGRLGGDVGPLAGLAGSENPAAVRAAAVSAVAGIDLHAAAGLASDLLARPGADPAAVVAPLAGRKGGPGALAEALAGRAIPKDAAKLAVRAVKASAQPSEALVAALAKAGGLDAASPPPTPEEVAALAAEVAAEGDPARGERIFRRADLQCLNCHAIAGAGGPVGPGLESIGASAPVDYLIDSILQPNKAVKEGYHSVVVALDDGRVVTGIPTLRTGEALALRDAEGQTLTVPTASIEAEKPGQSLMPEGQADALTRAELRDLVRFLSELGKPGPYAAGPRRLVRRWEVPGEGVRSLDSAGPWAPRYSLVSGGLPWDDVPEVALAGTAPRRWARFGLDVTTGGAVRLGLDHPEGLTLLVDGRPIDAAGTVDLDLGPGPHVVAVGADPGRPGGSLTVEVQDVPGSPARVQPVLGR
jgi:putative heme-binding domain-containing protein